ncbi:MAG: zinc ABC transporter substrate-binding protein [Thaumarchaeota archaeon]|nr:MAG: zinc ABC transporter substrate-binding protein [Nitrososphaerota archaeon]
MIIAINLHNVRINFIIIWFFLFLLILVSFYYQNSYGQNQGSNVTSESNENITSNTISRNISDIQSVQNTSHKLKVVSSFFPIAEFVKKIGGNLIGSSLLIPNGIEPHDFEPTINQIQSVNSADVLFYNGLRIESWIDKISIPHKIQSSASLNVSYYDKSNKTIDPHVWLDPEFAKKEVENIRDGLIAIDPNNRDKYLSNAKNFSDQLDSLDRTIRTDLQSCKKKDFISFHNSFSYFAKRYGLNQYSISNAGPEAEITPKRLTEGIDTEQFTKEQYRISRLFYV